jgi:LacI family transcriptional regulator
MASNDAIARPLQQAMEHFDLAVPDQVAIVGAENDPLLCEMGRVPLSSVDANTRKLGYEVAALLDRLMDGAPASGETLRVAPAGVVARQSTNMLAAENENAARALRFIWEHYREPISVEDVARDLPVSRRRLQTLFQQDFGRTIQAEISRVRAEAACRHLAGGDLKIHEVAARTGFSSSLHMHRTFLNMFGIGPRDLAGNGRPREVPRLPGPVPEPVTGSAELFS